MKLPKPDCPPRIPNQAFGYPGIHFAVRLRQGKVCNYQHNRGLLGTIDIRCFDWDMIAPRADELAHVTTLQIYLDIVPLYFQDDHVLWAGSIVARMPALRSLEIELKNWMLFEDVDCCESAVRVVQSIFDSQAETGQPMRLTSLRIKKMCLLRVSRLLTTVLDFKNLKHLQLMECVDIGPFLRELESLELNLSSLCIEIAYWDTTTGKPLNDFIRSLQPLQRLALTFTWPDDTSIVDEWTLQSHYRSLESLRIEDEFPHASLPVTTLVLEPTSNLEQLAWSGFKLEDGWLLSSGRVSCCDVQKLLVSVRLSDFKHNAILIDHLQDMLAPLRSLRVLKLTIWCSSLQQTATPTQILGMPPVQRTVKGAAKRIFALKLPKLTAVVFEVYGERSHLLTHKRFAFLRPKQADQVGGEKCDPISVEPYMVKHHVPCADILEAEKLVFA